MKLLPKKLINTIVENQKREQINEGVLIARKVDKLRETLADLELQQRTFIAGTKIQIERETKQLNLNVDKLKAEIKGLEEKRAELKRPLDAQWEEVKTKEQEILSKENKLKEYAEKFKVDRERLDETRKKESNSLHRIRIREKELERAYVLADQAKIEIEEIKKQTIHEKENQTNSFMQREQVLAKSEQEADFNAKANAHLKEILDKQKVEQDNRERGLNDKYATLQRTMDRLKK